MAGGRWVGAIAVVMVVLGLGYLGFRTYYPSQTEECYACQRVVHAHMRTVAMINGSARVFCCPACALSEHQQEGKPIRIIELTDFLTGAKLSPEQAFLVKGSDVNMCATKHEMTDGYKREADVHYDRCAPSLLAFGHRSEAAHFTQEHGGEILPFQEIASALAH